MITALHRLKTQLLYMVDKSRKFCFRLNHGGTEDVMGLESWEKG